MGHLLGCARVSTVDQDPQLQLDALDVAGCWRVWTDHASGSREHRPQLDELLDHLRDGDTLVVWRLDRLGRSLRHLLDVVSDLGARGVGLRSLTESIDTTTATGHLVFAVFAAMAEFERDLIRERTRWSRFSPNEGLRPRYWVTASSTRRAVARLDNDTQMRQADVETRPPGLLRCMDPPAPRESRSLECAGQQRIAGA